MVQIEDNCYLLVKFSVIKIFFFSYTKSTRLVNSDHWPFTCFEIRFVFRNVFVIFYDKVVCCNNCDTNLEVVIRIEEIEPWIF